MRTVPLGRTTCIIGANNSLNLFLNPGSINIPFHFPASDFKASPKSFSSLPRRSGPIHFPFSISILLQLQTDTSTRLVYFGFVLYDFDCVNIRKRKSCYFSFMWLMVIFLLEKKKRKKLVVLNYLNERSNFRIDY